MTKFGAYISALFLFFYCLPCQCINIYEKSALVEKSILQTWPEVFNKKRNILSIKFYDGTNTTLVDSREFDFQPKVINYLIAYWPEHNIVVINHTKKAGEISSVWLYPMSSATLFEQRKTYIGGWPMLSPNEKLFAAFDNNADPKNFSGVNIFQFNQGYISLLGSVKSALWGVSHLEWIDDTHIKFISQRACSKPECTKERTITIEKNGMLIN